MITQRAYAQSSNGFGMRRQAASASAVSMGRSVATGYAGQSSATGVLGRSFGLANVGGYGAHTGSLGFTGMVNAGTAAAGGAIRAGQAATVSSAMVGTGGSIAPGYIAPSYARPGVLAGGAAPGVPGIPGIPGVPGTLGAVGIPFDVNEKQVLQALNDRLASYLGKVKNLETINRELEEKLRAFTINKVQIRDLQVYEDQLVPLRQQVLTLLHDNAVLALDLDNAKLAADDFRTKYETEYVMRQSVEGDIAGLKTLKTEYDLSIEALRQDFQVLTDELTTMRKVHEEEVIALRNEMAGTVTVDIQAAETTNLARVLEEMRTEYETVVQQNRAEIETWYTKQVELKQMEEQKTTATTVETSTEILESRKTVHSLQSELESVRVTELTLKEQLYETEMQYQMQLQRLNGMVVVIETDLASVRDSALLQAQDYQALLNIKMKLEMEIATYRALLEGASVEAATSAVVQQQAGAGAAVAVGGGGLAVAGAVAASSSTMQSSSMSQASSSQSASSQSSAMSAQAAGGPMPVTMQPMMSEQSSASSSSSSMGGPAMIQQATL
ncbi:hypothetical protein GJAV_G00146010 [Gymnothorax javanicus]|nr:hypothetical protein GJAV_G00146010 [Gymnothorax javanicus]